MGWRCGSSGRVPTLQGQALSSNHSPTKKKITLKTLKTLKIPYIGVSSTNKVYRLEARLQLRRSEVKYGCLGDVYLVLQFEYERRFIRMYRVNSAFT
jgi:hypothetical protein